MELISDRRVAPVGHPSFCRDHEVYGVREELRVLAEGLAHPALDPIADDGVADLSRDGDAQPRPGRGARLDGEDEATSPKPLPSIADPKELAPLLEARLGREAEGAPRQRRALLGGDSHAQPLAPLAAARGEDLAARVGGHALAEPMLVLALAVARLEGALHVRLLRVSRSVERGAVSVSGAR